MLIDWFTVGAQVFNFLLLIWLLKRFLYKPILNAIDARETRIAAEVATADQKKAEALKESDEFRQKNEAFDQQHAALLNKMTDEAKTERQRLFDEARLAAARWSSKRWEALRSEEQQLRQALRLRMQQEVFAIARKALTDLAASSFEERLVAIFTRRLREMEGPAKECLALAIKTATEPLLIRSAFDLPLEQRAVIQNALNETFSADISLRFEAAPNLIGGIELAANGQKVAWSIEAYLASLENGVAAMIEEKNKLKPEVIPAETTPRTESQ